MGLHRWLKLWVHRQRNRRRGQTPLFVPRISPGAVGENVFAVGLATAPMPPIILGVPLGTWRFHMIASYQSSSEHPLVNPGQARTVLGVLGLLIRMVGPCSSLGIVLQQARSEVASLLQ